MTRLCVFIQTGSMVILLISSLVVLFQVFLWSNSVVVEGLTGFRWTRVSKLLGVAFVMFLLTEVFFFISIFWAFFDCYLHRCSLDTDILGIIHINPIGLPFLNTILLLASGITLTVVHYTVVSKESTVYSWLLTIMQGAMFMWVQCVEYYSSILTMTDSRIGSVFYFSTGFHGLHVVVGLLLLVSVFLRLLHHHFSSLHHLLLESGIIYWHFVDIIWIYLYTFVYQWFHFDWEILCGLYAILCGGDCCKGPDRDNENYGA